MVQGSLRSVLEPIFEQGFAEQSYGFRPERGCKDALRQVDKLLKAGKTWVVDADIKGYFDSVSHERMMEEIEKKVSDGRVLRIIAAFLKQGVMESMKEWTPEQGTPQGAVISPLLSNIYLDELDHTIAEKGMQMVRYADDFVILSGSKEEAEAALRIVKEWMCKAQLQLHPEKTKIVNANEPGGFDFLGYHFERGYRWPRKKSLKKFRDTIRRKTKRTNGQSLQAIIIDLNRTMKGWFEYFKHSHCTTYPHEDGWIRMRLRSILRKRAGKKGRGRGSDHQRWPNKFFAEYGLFSLTAAHEPACQSRGG
jgi:RNA-directed DNA polymerase